MKYFDECGEFYATYQKLGMERGIEYSTWSVWNVKNMNIKIFIKIMCPIAWAVREILGRAASADNRQPGGRRSYLHLLIFGWIFLYLDWNCVVTSVQKPGKGKDAPGGDLESASIEELNQKISTLEKEKNKEEEYRNYMQLERVRFGPANSPKNTS